MNKIAIIILNKSNNKMLFSCLSSIKEKTNNKNFHIYIGDTGSSELELKEVEKFIKIKFGNAENVDLINFDNYNFARNNNDIVKNFTKDENLLLFCNNDIKLVDDCITEALKVFEKNHKKLGTLGFKLLFADDTIQHAGQILFVNFDQKIHLVTHRGLGQEGSLFSHRDEVIGNTGGFMFTEKDLFLQIGGFNETYTECYEDVEYNLQCLLNGRKNLYIGDKIAYHYESQTRNKNSKKSSNQNLDLALNLGCFVDKHIDKLLEKNLIYRNSKFTVCSLCRDANSKNKLFTGLVNFFPEDSRYLLIDNSIAKTDCYQAINTFIAQATGDFILIIHDDVSFDGLNCSNLINELRRICELDPKAALFGIAGVSLTSYSSIGHFRDAAGEHKWGFHEGGLASSLDECFLVLRRDRGLSVSNELSGYHFYGTDLCINAREKGLASYVIDFPIIHKSTGSLDKNFFEARNQFEEHLQKKSIPRFVRTTCTVMYGGRNKIKQAWALAMSLDLVEKAQHKDLLVAKECILNTGHSRYGILFFSIILFLHQNRNKKFRFKTRLFKRIISDFIWWRKNWRSRFFSLL
jgi:GT2 family glycosyltransferase